MHIPALLVIKTRSKRHSCYHPILPNPLSDLALFISQHRSSHKVLQHTVELLRIPYPHSLVAPPLLSPWLSAVQRKALVSPLHDLLHPNHLKPIPAALSCLTQVMREGRRRPGEQIVRDKGTEPFYRVTDLLPVNETHCRNED